MYFQKFLAGIAEKWGQARFLNGGATPPLWTLPYITIDSTAIRRCPLWPGTRPTRGAECGCAWLPGSGSQLVLWAILLADPGPANHTMALRVAGASRHAAKDRKPGRDRTGLMVCITTIPRSRTVQLAQGKKCVKMRQYLRQLCQGRISRCRMNTTNPNNRGENALQ